MFNLGAKNEDTYTLKLAQTQRRMFRKLLKLYLGYALINTRMIKRNLDYENLILK